MLNMESNSLVIDLKPDWSELDKISDLLEKFLNDPSFNRDDFDALKITKFPGTPDGHMDTFRHLNQPSNYH